MVEKSSLSVDTTKNAECIITNCFLEKKNNDTANIYFGLIHRFSLLYKVRGMA